MNTNWDDFPYYPISQFYRNKFGEKVYKVPVSVAQTCPNREGLRGMKVCNFCDEWGSAAYPEVRDQDLRQQIEGTKARLGRRFNVKKFLVYFQAYTSTFAKTATLREQFSVASQFKDVVGFVVGTRPDCVSDAVIDLWNDYVDDKFLSVELGVQSFDEGQLVWMSRGHTADRSIKAINKISREAPAVNLGIHLMFGLPNESDEDIVRSAKICSELPIHNVKIHNLHVLTGTPLAEDYKLGKFKPISRERYADHVVLFLKHLRPDIAVHRLSATASRYDELVAPQWAMSKMDSYQYILDRLKTEGVKQGQLFQ